MNTPTETTGEIGKVAHNVIDTFYASPALLAVIVLQMSTLGVLYFVNSSNNQHRQEREMKLLEHCLPGIPKS